MECIIDRRSYNGTGCWMRSKGRNKESEVQASHAADETARSPSMAGFVLTGENGGPNIVFGMRDGKLAVLGINY